MISLFISPDVTGFPSPKVQPIPFDDIIVFAYNARRHGVKFWLTNEEPFGKLIGPLAENYGVEDDKNQVGGRAGRGGMGVKRGRVWGANLSVRSQKITVSKTIRIR